MDNPHSEDPRRALHPRSDSGKRLLDLTGLSLDFYERTFERRNYSDLTSYSVLRGRVVVVLGVAVWRWLLLPPTAFFSRLRRGDTTYYCVPHPSGLNRLYNDEEYREKARRLLRSIAKEYAS